MSDQTATLTADLTINSWGMRAVQAMPGGVSSNFRMAEGPDQLVVSRARGAHLWDVAGQKYVDYTCGYGAVLFGYADADINAAVAAQLELGYQVSATHTREVQLAEEISLLLPGMESVRFHVDGTEAVQTALRVARAATGRAKVICFSGHYHGWLPLGSEEDMLVLPWNDVAALTAAFDADPEGYAAVITEAVMCNNGCFEAAPGYLSILRQLCTEHGSLFILDEIITGFRLGFQGAIGAYLLTGNLGPDLAVYGKALGGGLPIGLLAGKRRYMDVLANQQVNHSGTFNGNSLSIAASVATLAKLRLRGQKFYMDLHERGRKLMADLEGLGREAGVPLLVRGPGPVFWVTLGEDPEALPISGGRPVEPAVYQRFRHHLLARGVRVMPAGRWYVSASHSDDDVDFTLAVVRASLGAMQEEEAE
ncbi:MAG TPA: aminotransferase class III-fold pyridoxal phosphate-dependent enzyme [Burkholderiales bacterium]|jgi:glutamate-1-semialdehyde 2,1-aminomutase|nr:aminotransferase class III-fold pyridoxal phosphate-dependent enzyme [Burkholderiales bacterium]